MKKSLSFNSTVITHTIQRYHSIIFIIIVAGGLTLLMLELNNILSNSSEQVTPGTDGLSATFDQKTIDRIEKLRTRNDKTSDLDLSGGRINPFVE